MPHHHDHYYRDGYELALDIKRDLRHSHRPTRYIVNHGKLIVDDRSFEDRDRSSSSHSNTLIYNAPGSTMWIENKSSHSAECRRCYRRRDRLYGGYCSDCVSLRLDTPRHHDVVVKDHRRLLELPERRAIGWR
ncbi:hypothetical protein EKO27_g9310 [Xylaria grammica]|uniref:Uncharacterized protein n=1 Tax=Xylaria grammica TaxID=363999 RepID=A0A439CUN4_9PEZI|nr:hypothetical protein EKO27_g9310 [Xylaria grammica]GAW24036.1 hypothetical protein ANO14919_136150 [Xylariales sp. No.14919]